MAKTFMKSKRLNLLATANKDGEDIHEIEKIESLGDGKYIVHYNDMGNKGSHTITTVIQDGEIFFDKLD